VARKIRHIIAANLNLLPSGSLLVIRALPAANTADLKSEATELISKLVKKAEQKNTVTS
jgi:RNase P protein component